MPLPPSAPDSIPDDSTPDPEPPELPERQGAPALDATDDDSALPMRPDLLAGQAFPPPPKQERSRRKRDALLTSALALFGERGYDETSIEEIARRAGVAVGGFYQYFASKRQLLLMLMDRLLEEIAGFMMGAQLGGERVPYDVSPPVSDHVPDQAPGGAPIDLRMLIAGFVRRGLQLDWSYAGAYRAWREASAQDRDLRALHRRIERWSAAQLEFLLRMLLQAPGARRGVDVATLAEVLSLLFWRLAEAPLEEPDATIAAVTDLIYHALFTDGSGTGKAHAQKSRR
jgi:AcrR family transcriptional regulator